MGNNNIGFFKERQVGRYVGQGWVRVTFIEDIHMHIEKGRQGLRAAAAGDGGNCKVLISSSNV